MTVKRTATARALTLLFALVFFQGCVVTASEPFGEEPVVLDPAIWNGTWFNGEAVVLVRVADAENGILDILGFDSNDSVTTAETVQAYVRSVGSAKFASIANEDSDAEQPQYVWAMIENDGSQLTVWHPDRDRFSDAVSLGNLPGRFEGEDVILEGLKPQHYDAIMSEEFGVLFEWKEPVTMIKLID